VPRGAIVLSVVAPAAGVDAEPGLDGGAGGGVAVPGIVAAFDAPSGAVGLSAALPTPYPDSPTAEAINAYAILLFSLRIMSRLL